MTILAIYDETGAHRTTVTDFDAIATQLHGIGVLFERWQAQQVLTAESNQDEVLTAYRDSVDRLKQHYGFQSADVVALHPNHPDKVAFRNKFLNEHLHEDFEVRFFVAGQGLFYLHVGDSVYCVLCRQGDLISVPANTTHWFDMGEHPRFRCIRLFTTPEGWVAKFTGSDIATRLPSFEQFIAAHA